MSRRVWIIGAGKFGLSLLEQLQRENVEVIMVDCEEGPIERIAQRVPVAMVADATQMEVLENIGIRDCDTVVVAIGSNVEASILVTANCKELEVPRVIAKAKSKTHRDVLRKIGADQVVFPEQDSANRLAHHIVTQTTIDLLEISEGLYVTEIGVPEMCRDKSLAQCDLRNKTGVSVLCIRRPDEEPGRPYATITPGPNDAIRENDKLIVFGRKEAIDKLVAEGK